MNDLMKCDGSMQSGEVSAVVCFFRYWMALIPRHCSGYSTRPDQILLSAEMRLTSHQKFRDRRLCFDLFGGSLMCAGLGDSEEGGWACEIDEN